MSSHTKIFHHKNYNQSFKFLRKKIKTLDSLALNSNAIAFCADVVESVNTYFYDFCFTSLELKDDLKK